MPLFAVAPHELTAVVDFVNAAYRGDSARRGWSSEADLIGGTRTTVDALAEAGAPQPGAGLFVLREDVAGAILGTALLEAGRDAMWTIGMLTVRPDLQGAGIGRALLAEAEEAAIRGGARVIELTVIHLRAELIAWYRRRGYRPTDETKPFPYHDRRFGTPLRADLRFVVLQKQVGEHPDSLRQ